MEIYGLSDVGHKRQNNEDNFLIITNGKEYKTQKLTTNDSALIIIADGMGGHQAGEVASEIAVKEVKNYWLNTAEQNTKDKLFNSIEYAHRRILEQAKQNPAQKGMGTTIVVAYIDKKLIHIAWVGDSRAYCLKFGKLKQVTKDHSLVQELIDRKVLVTKEQIDNFPHKNIISQSLGSEKGIRPNYTVISLCDCQTLLLCTDGLTSMLTNEQIEKIINSYSDTTIIVKKLINAANQAGGEDNITVVIAKVDKPNLKSVKTFTSKFYKTAVGLFIIFIIAILFFFIKSINLNKHNYHNTQNNISKKDSITENRTDIDTTVNKIVKNKPKITALDSCFQESDFDDIKFYSDGDNDTNYMPLYCKIKQEDKWGFAKKINDSCFSIKVKPKYSTVYFYFWNYAFVKDSNKWLLIDTNGKVIYKLPANYVPVKGYHKENNDTIIAVLKYNNKKYKLTYPKNDSVKIINQ